MTTKRILIASVSMILLTSCLASSKGKREVGLKDVLKDKFLIGVAMNRNQITGDDSKGDGLIIKHFNSVVADNCMKSEVTQPVEGQFNFSLADKFVKFGEQHNMFIIGHTLVWHSQAPSWFFVDEKGQPVSRNVLVERMHKHINALVTRYKGRVKGWDVVNEAINDDGTWRESPFYKIIGKDYVKLAFQFAHEADPNAQLYYNDYNMEKEGRRNSVVALVKELQKQGIKIDAIGMQSHLTMDYPTYDAFEKSINAFAALGVKVMITELDLTVLPFPKNEISADVALSYKYDPKLNPYINGLTDSASVAFENRLESFFKLFIKYKDQISRVTVWGLSDKDSWKNDFPVKGRTDYPLLFDRNYEPKLIVKKLIEENKK
jgi:endo-1,4-beta-xylanase